MKNRFPILILSTLLLTAGALQAQEEESSTNSAPATSSLSFSSSLQVGELSDTERIDLLLEVADVYFAEKRYEEAVSAYERILEIDPEQLEARITIGHVYISAKQYAKAEAMLKGLIEDYPDDFQLKNNLAWLYSTAEDPAFRKGRKAVELAQEAMVIAPLDHHVWSTLAEAYYVIGDYEKAYRAITHMASLAMRYGTNITQDMIDEYNEQIRKCKRAWDSQKALEELNKSDNDSPESTTTEPAAEPEKAAREAVAE
ncbi:MAG: tetratricopeptide repeat protein [Pontiellaceae bacterium]|nr:tetratricopeptide repeat protein [Pontiellaceae bacterium]MBN2783949.1 tetratricopeptide repeat protein [Pontiellaceae bacterium]